MLLALTGGVLDAIIYLTHGHVFANAMTGNVVLLGLSLIAHDWAQAIRHIGPIVAFLAGIVAAKALRSMPDGRAIAVGLLFEILTLGVAGALPGTFPELVFVPMVAFASAFQTANFRKVHTTSYNSTFVTGNLRDMTEGLFDGLRPSLPPEQRREGRAKGLALAGICLCFFAGVLSGGWLAPRFHNHALWFPIPLLAVVAVLVFLRKNQAS
jgi:uncharacterized membrane protein YoaK (UPF0700 family)